MEPTGTFTAPDGSLKRNRANPAKIVTAKETIEINQGTSISPFKSGDKT
jgi:hypothetical protein